MAWLGPAGQPRRHEKWWAPKAALRVEPTDWQVDGDRVWEQDHVGVGMRQPCAVLGETGENHQQW